MRRILGILLGAGGGLIAVAAVAAGLFWLWLQGDGGRHWVGERIMTLARTPDVSLTVGGVEGEVPFAMTLTGVTVADHKGQWLSARRAGLTIDAGALLGGRVEVTALRVDRVDMTRPPLPLPDTDDASVAALVAPVLRAPALWAPVLPVPVTVRRLVVDELALGAAVLGGEPALLHAEGEVRLGSGAPGLGADFVLSRRDGQPGGGHLHVAYAPADDRLDVDLALAEPAGGVLVRALQVPGLPALAFDATGSAPLADWHGALTLRANGRTLVSADAKVRRVRGGHAIALSAGGDPTSLLSPAWATLIGPTPHLALDLLADANGGLTLRPGSVLTAAAGTARVEGLLQADSNRLALRVTAQPAAAALVAAGLLPAGSRWHQATVEATLDGTPAAPALGLDLKADGVDSGGLNARALNGRLQVAAPVEGRRALGLEAAIDYLTGTDATVTRLAGPHAQITAAGSLEPGSPTLKLSRLSLTVAAGKLTGTATLAPREHRLEASGHFAVDQLNRLLGPFGLPLSGVADLEIKLKAGGTGAQAQISGSAGNLGLDQPALDPVLAALTGAGVRLSGTVTLDGQGAVRARDWRLDGQAVTASGQADWIDHRLDANARLQIGQLEGLATPLGLGTLAGAATVALRLQGPQHPGGGPVSDGLTAQALLSVTDLAVDGRKLGRNEAELAGGGLPDRPHATLKLRALTGLAGLTPVTAGATLTLARDGKTLTLADLAVAQGDNRATGTLGLALDGSELDGHVGGQLPNLEALAPLAGTALHGRGRFDVVTGRRDGRQVLAVAFGANALHVGDSDFATAGEIEVKGSLNAASPAQLAAGRLGGALTVTGQALKAGGMALAALNGGLEGGPDQATFHLSAPGAAGQPPALDLAMTIGRGADSHGVKVRLDRLGGQLGALPLSLSRPATVTLGRDRLAVAGLRLAGPDFWAEADAGVGPDGLKGRVDARNLPLELLQRLLPGLPDGGRVDAQATLSGSLAQPRAELTAHFRDVGQAEAEAAGLTVGGFNGVVDAHWHDGRLAMEGKLRAGHGSADLRFQGEAPLGLRLAPLALAMPDGGALQGSVTGGIDMAMLNDRLATSGDRLAGRLAVDLKLGGTVAAPQFGGWLTVADGRYENQILGLAVERISARLAGDGQTLTIDHFSGQAANGGAVTVAGSLRLATAQGDGLNLQITARNARLVDIDMATADVDADLTLTGGFAAARLAGGVQVRRADIRLPDRLPPEVVDLMVTELGKATELGKTGSAAAPVRLAEVVQPAAPTAGNAPLPRRKPRLPPAMPSGSPLAALPHGSPLAALPIGPPRAIDLALTVTSTNQLFVRGRGLDSQFGCDLRLDGNLRQPQVKGTLTMQRGKLDLLGKEFQFKHGTITFARDNELNPDLDMLAEAKAIGITAEAEVSGSLHAPHLVLSSDPVLPPDEVLARVLFDKPVSQLGALEAVQLANSAAQLAGIGGSAGLVDRVRRSLGVDRLGVTTTITGSSKTTGSYTGGNTIGNTSTSSSAATVAGNTSTSALEVGRYVTNDLYLGVEQGLAGDSGRAKMEVGITDNVQATAGMGIHADPDIGLKFEWNY